MQPRESAARPVRVGTSGYSYPEWVDAGFYPSGTRPGGMLALYAQRFAAAELNYTWYQMPKAHALERMCRHVPVCFRFAVKLNRTLTHEVDPDQWREQAARYRDGIAPLVLAGQLAAVLLQLPPAFDRTPKRRRYLAALLDALEGEAADVVDAVPTSPAVNGRVTTKRLPCPNPALCASTVPSCNSTSCFTKVRPSPSPPLLRSGVTVPRL